jgi:hypothetical protein
VASEIAAGIIDYPQRVASTASTSALWRGGGGVTAPYGAASAAMVKAGDSEKAWAGRRRRWQRR